MNFLTLVLFIYIFTPAIAGVLGLDALKYILPISLFIGLAKYYLTKKGMVNMPRLHIPAQVLILFIHAAVILYSYLRTNNAESSTIGFLNIALNWMMLIMVIWGVFTFKFSQVRSVEEYRFTFRRAMFSLYIPIALCVIIAVVAYFLGYRMIVDEGEKDVLAPGLFASLLGLSLDRTGFIIGGHPNGFGIFVSITMIMSVIVFHEARLNSMMKWLNRLTIASCFFALIIVDSRASIGIMLIVLMLYYLMRFAFLEKILHIIYWAIPVLAIFMLVVLQFIAQTSLASSVSRSDNELASGNSRGYIWNACIEELSEFEEKQILGYGQQGHIPSGAAKRYEKYLLRITYTHSFYFQTVFDSGYLGLFLTLLMMYLSLKNGLKMRKHNLPYASIFALFPILFCLVGIFEAPYGEYNSMVTSLYNCIVYFSIFLYNHYIKFEACLKEEPTTLPSSC